MIKRFIGAILFIFVVGICGNGTSSVVFAKLLIPDGQKAPEANMQVIEKRNTNINGRHYEYVEYTQAIGEQEIRIMSLRTKDEELVIPSTVDGKKVVEVGTTNGDAHHIGPNGELEIYNLNQKVLPWQLNEKQQFKKVVVSEGIQQIVGNGFSDIIAQRIELPKSLKNIGEDIDTGHSRCFWRAKINQVRIKGKKTNIGMYTFREAELKEIKFPSTFQGKIRHYAFAESKLTEFTWPSYKSGASKKIGRSLFMNCKKLKKVVFPKNQAHIYIPDSTFYGCTKLKKLTFPASTKKVTYRWHAYADNFKMGPQTLEFKGKKTKLAGTKFEYKKNSKPLLTVGKIIVPPKSKALAYAKKAKKIKSFSKYTIKVGIQGEEGPETNYADRTGDGLLKLTKLKYVIRK